MAFPFNIEAEPTWLDRHQRGVIVAAVLIFLLGVFA